MIKIFTKIPEIKTNQRRFMVKTTRIVLDVAIEVRDVSDKIIT